MIRKIIAIIMSILSLLPFIGNGDKIKVKIEPLSSPLEEFSMQNVTLLDSYEQNAFNKEVEYLKSLDSDRLMRGLVIFQAEKSMQKSTVAGKHLQFRGIH